MIDVGSVGQPRDDRACDVIPLFPADDGRPIRARSDPAGSV
jgi:hypothetical protein